MKLRKTATNKISLSLQYDYYTTLCSYISSMQMDFAHRKRMSKKINLEILIDFAIVSKLLNRLSKADYYPFKSNVRRVEKVTVLLEMEEALLLYKYMPGLSDNPLVGFINREMHNIIIN